MQLSRRCQCRRDLSSAATKSLRPHELLLHRGNREREPTSRSSNARSLWAGADVMTASLQLGPSSFHVRLRTLARFRRTAGPVLDRLLLVWLRLSEALSALDTIGRMLWIPLRICVRCPCHPDRCVLMSASRRLHRSGARPHPANSPHVLIVKPGSSESARTAHGCSSRALRVWARRGHTLDTLPTDRLRSSMLRAAGTVRSGRVCPCTPSRG